MGTRNCETRPVTWKIHRNKQLAQAVDAMGEFYKDSKKGFIVWPMWIGFITHRDNLGFFDGAPGSLRDSFYPHHPEITLEEVNQARNILHEKGLIIVYQVDGLDYVLVPKVGKWSRIVGNISEKTDFPLPSPEVITSWEQRFNDVYTPLKRCPDSVRSEIESKSKREIENKKEKEEAYKRSVVSFFNSLDSEWINELKIVYPNAKLDEEFPKMRIWLLSNTDTPRKNFKKFALNWIKNPRESKAQGSKLNSNQLDSFLQKELGSIATLDMVKNVLRGLHKDLWWKVDAFLKRRYTGSNGEVFSQAEKIVLQECEEVREKFKSIAAGIGKAV